MSEFICSNCGATGTPKTITKGSFLLELIFWFGVPLSYLLTFQGILPFVFLVLALIYTSYRRKSSDKVCASCNAQNLVPTNSPMGQKLKADLQPKPPENKAEKGPEEHPE